MMKFVSKSRALLPLLALVASPAFAAQQPAISAFNAWCFKSPQTESAIRANMQADYGEPLPFTLTFWDDNLEPRPANSPHGIERRCEVLVSGDHTDAALDALLEQMATPPVFGTEIPLPSTHSATLSTTFIQGRELLRGRVAVVHIGTRDGNTFIAVDRLYSGLGLAN